MSQTRLRRPYQRTSHYIMVLTNTGPKSHINTRIVLSGSKAKGKKDFQKLFFGRILMFSWSCQPLQKESMKPRGGAGARRPGLGGHGGEQGLPDSHRDAVGAFA